MRIRGYFALTLAGGLIAAAIPAGASAAPSTRATTDLPLVTAVDVVSSGDRVFVSGGRAATDIVVTSATGALQTTISGLPGPTDLLLSNDRRTLYVALPTAGEIAAFDTGTLRESARYDVGADTCPSTLALTGRYLWFGYGCDGWDGDIGRIDLGRQPAVVRGDLAPENYYGAPMVATASQNRTVLLVGQPGTSPASADVFAIGAGGALTHQGSSAHGPLGSFLNDLALDPSGSILYTATSAPYEVQAFPVGDITAPSKIYPTGAYPNALELSRDGTRLAGGADAAYDPDVFVFDLDGTERFRFELGDELVRGALAWSPNATRLYAVTADWTGALPTRLHVLPVPLG